MFFSENWLMSKTRVLVSTGYFIILLTASKTYTHNFCEINGESIETKLPKLTSQQHTYCLQRVTYLNIFLFFIFIMKPNSDVCNWSSFLNNNKSELPQHQTEQEITFIQSKKIITVEGESHLQVVVVVVVVVVVIVVI